MDTWLVLTGTALGGLLVGLLGGVWLRRLEARRWIKTSVEMARINDELMDRVELLEGELRKE